MDLFCSSGRVSNIHRLLWCFGLGPVLDNNRQYHCKFRPFLFNPSNVCHVSVFRVNAAQHRRLFSNYKLENTVRDVWVTVIEDLLSPK